jgi:hypothetical protein
MTNDRTGSSTSVRPLTRWWWRPPAFLGGLLAIVAALYVFGSRVYLAEEVQRDLSAQARMDQRRVLLLGASHAHDLRLADARLDGVDLAHRGQDLFEMAYIARAVKKRAQRMNAVLVTLSYFSFLFDNAAYLKGGIEERVERRIHLYSAFRRWAFIPGDSAEFLKGRLFPLVTRDHYLAAFQRLPSTLPSVMDGDEDDDPDEEEPGGSASVKRSRRKKDTWFASHARSRCHAYRRYMTVMQQNHPRLAQDTFESLLGLVRELEGSNIHVVLFTPPYLKPYSDCFDPDARALTFESAHRIEQTTHARYFDFSRHPDFAEHGAYFDDSDHLNDRGQLAFSKLFAEVVGPLLK